MVGCGGFGGFGGGVGLRCANPTYANQSWLFHFSDNLMFCSWQSAKLGSFY
jgi:hypothetical protein